MKNVHFAIPEIYGDSLSYYELLRKLIDKINDLIDNYNTVPEQISEEVKNLPLFNQLINSIATDNTKSTNVVKAYKKNDLLYATFNETVNLYESLINFSTGTATELIPGTNIREVNISELFIELRELIDAEAQTREQADTSLQQNINAESSAREQADTTLQHNINTEVSAREQADTALQNAINTEVSAREQADTALQNAINTEKSAREESDNTLQTKIETINDYIAKSKTYVTPEMFGAVGDGVEDDTQALSEAFNSNEIVYLKENATYAVTGSITGNVKRIVGNGAKIVLKNNIDILFSVDNIDYIGDVEIDCNNNGIRFCIRSSAKNPTIKNVTIHSIRDMRSDNFTICIGLYNAYSVMLDGINVHDCCHVINGNIGDANGNISAIYVENWTNTCTIKNSIFSEIHNINSNGEIAFEDSNGIYARSVLDNSYLTIDNVYCKNGGKRLIKTQCLNVSINNVNGYFDSVDNLSIIGIGSLEDDSGRVAKATISNCNLNSKHMNSINCYLITSSEDVVISNCILTTNGNNASILNTRKMIIESCLFSGDGLVNNGISLSVNNSTFRNISRYTHYSTYNKNLKDITFDCCTFEDCSNFAILAESIVSNCKFYGTGIVQSGGNAILTDCSMYKQQIDSIIIQSGNMKAINIKSIADVENTTRCINLKSESSIDIDGLYTENFSYSIIGTGNVKARNIDISMVLGNGFASYSNEPPYVDSLPPKENLIPNGTLCILKTDGRLYKTDNKAWVAVN